MRFRTLATFTLFALIAIPGSLRAQDDDAAVTARYEAALEWWHWIRDGEWEKAAARVNSAVAAQMGAAEIESAVTQVRAQVGDLISLEPKRQEMLEGFHVVIHTAVYTSGTYDAQVFMADDHTVAGFFLRPPS